MRRIGTMFLIALSMMASFASPSLPAQEPSKDCIAVSGVKGKVTYRTGGVQEQVQVMQRIVPGATLVIEKGTSVSLSRAGYKTLKLTHENSPYKVEEARFERDGSVLSKTLEHLKNAIFYYVYPGSQPSAVVRLVTRGQSTEEEPCQKGIWPMHKSDILYQQGEPMTFKWDLKGKGFSLKIVEPYAHATVYDKELSSNQVDMPMTAFKPGKKYEWSVAAEGTGERCSAIFRLLGEDESAEIMANLSALRSHLPAEADEETRYRLEAGYLSSELLVYDAWRLLERHGIRP